MAINDFSMDSKQVYDVLKKKGVNNFHNANTVLTSLTYIEHRALLSRKYVDLNGLKQTVQTSDDKDKKVDVYDDLFLDGTDLHLKYRRNNLYGPVLFILKLDLLLMPDFSRMFITKNNPIYWDETRDRGEYYYNDIKELERDYLTGEKLRDGRIMFTFKNKDAKLTLNKYCEKIILDDPNKKVNINGVSFRIVDRAKEKLEIKLKEKGLGRIPVEIRHSGLDITCCAWNYYWMKEPELRKNFGT